MTRQITPPRVHHFRDGSIGFVDASIMAERVRTSDAHLQRWLTRRERLRENDPLLSHGGGSAG